MRRKYEREPKRCSNSLLVIYCVVFTHQSINCLKMSAFMKQLSDFNFPRVDQKLTGGLCVNKDFRVNSGYKAMQRSAFSPPQQETRGTCTHAAAARSVTPPVGNTCTGVIPCQIIKSVRSNISDSWTDCSLHSQ